MKKEIPIKYGALAAVFGTALMLLGIFSGEAQQVLNKAVRICLECIGIG